MTGTLNVYIPRRADGELMTGPVSKRRPYPKSVDVRTFFDPLADRNLPNALPTPKPKPFNPLVAPRGWRLRPVERASLPEVAVPAEHCGRRFRTPSGLAWHMTNAHPVTE
jgi:hypothetical protein